MDERIGRSLPTTDRGWQLYLTNIRPPRKRKWLSMGNGLVVCLEPSGKKTFQTRPRRKGEKNPRRVNIGSFPACSVIDARRRQLELNSVVAEGRDPALEQRRARAGVSPLRTLNDLIREYLGRRDGQVAAKTLTAERNLLEGVLAPALGDRLLADLAPVDFGKAISDYVARLRREGRSDGANANKLLKASRRMFKMARGWGIDIPDRDPTVGLANPAKEVPRDRILFDGRVLVGPDPRVNEIGRLASALLAEPSPVPVSRPTRLALMLDAVDWPSRRRVCSLEWRGISLDGDAPTVSVTTSKTRAGLRTLPLPRAAVAILTELRAQAGKGAVYVFPGADGARPPRGGRSTCTPKASAAALREPARGSGSPAPRRMIFDGPLSGAGRAWAMRASPSGSPATPRATSSAAITTAPANWARCASRSRHGPTRSPTRAGGSRRKGRERPGGVRRLRRSSARKPCASPSRKRSKAGRNISSGNCALRGRCRARLRLWLADLLDPEGGSEFAARLTRRTSPSRPAEGDGAKNRGQDGQAPAVRRHVAALASGADAPIDPSVRLRLARWFDPEAQTFVKATIRRRRAGAPSRPSRRMVRAAYHVVVNIEPDAKLERAAGGSDREAQRTGEPKNLEKQAHRAPAGALARSLPEGARGAPVEPGKKIE